MRFVSDFSTKIASFFDEPIPLPPPEPQPAPTEKELAYCRWVAENGDKTHRLNYDLQPSDIVYDLGGYQGQWSSDIYSRYLCQIHIFEPVDHFAREIKSRFMANPNIYVHSFALGAEAGEMEICLSDDASSSFRASGEFKLAPVIAFQDWTEQHNIQEIALLKINIEGGEYDLLDHVVDSGMIKLIRNIQVQFHDFVPGSTLRRQRIHESLIKTHRITYNYPFVWENWQLIHCQST